MVILQCAEATILGKARQERGERLGVSGGRRPIDREIDQAGLVAGSGFERCFLCLSRDDESSATRPRLHEAAFLQGGKSPGHCRDIDPERPRDLAMGREPFAADQFAARDARADCVREALIDRKVVGRQFQIVEHARVGGPSVQSLQCFSYHGSKHRTI